MPIEIKELLGEIGSSDESSDSDQDNIQYTTISSQSRYRLRKKPSAPLSLDETIKEVNAKLEQDEVINVLDPRYPKLFIVHFRGIHFFSQFFQQQERRSTRNHIKSKKPCESIYSSAVYELAELPVGSIIDTTDKKKKIKNANKLLQDDLKVLGQKQAAIAWWGNNKEHETLLFQHYQRYVNNYEAFRRESVKKEYACYQKLSFSKNPYVSTSDEAKHAVLYALGGKAELSHGVLRPTYRENGRAKHPKVGYVQIIFHTIPRIVKKKPLFLSVLHAERKVDIKTRLLNERETTYTGSISAKHVVSIQMVRFPSFNVEFSDAFHKEKYGIKGKRSFNQYKKMARGESKNHKTNLLDKLAEHYAEKLMEEARRIAKLKGGYIVYFGLDGKLHKALTTTQDISTIRKQNTLVKTPMFKNNASQFFAPESDTDSEAEFPNVKDSVLQNPGGPPKDVRIPSDDEGDSFAESSPLQKRTESTANRGNRRLSQPLAESTKNTASIKDDVSLIAVAMQASLDTLQQEEKAKREQSIIPNTAASMFHASPAKDETEILKPSSPSQ